MERQDYVVFIGSPCIDEYYEVYEWPVEGAKFNGRFKGNVPGGMIANAACVLAGYGVKTYCFFPMGDDASLKFLLDDMESNHVDMSRMVITPGKINSKCIIFQGKSDRTILVVMGDSWKIQLTKQQLDFLCGARYVYGSLPGLKVFENPVAVLRTLKECGVRLVLDNEASTYVEDWRDYMQFCYLASLNEHGIERLAEGRTEAELERELLDDLGVQIMVKTLGKHGCEVVTRSERFSAPVYDVPVTDTTGAGDTFNSSFVYGLCRGMSLRDTARFATAAANMAIMKQGPRGGITTEPEVLEFMKNHDN